MVVRRRSVLLIKFYSDYQIKKNEMGGSCGTYGGEERGIQVSGGETCRKDTALDEKIILKWIFKEWNWGIDQVSGSE